MGTIFNNVSFGSVNPIKIHAAIIPIENSKVKIVFTTKLRMELIFLAFFCILTMYAYFFGKGTVSMLINLIPIGTIIWFWYIYRLQEKMLLERIEGYLRKLTR